MLAASIPAKFPIPFAANAGGSFVRAIPQTTTTPGAASLDQGFPPITFTPVGGGGDPPDGRDMNGILKETTLWSQWQQAGGPIGYDPTFSSAISGYPKGALISAAALGSFWLSLVDANTSDPDTGGANWAGITLISGALPTTGTMQHRMAADVLDGWAILNATTIGNASSNATQLAAASTLALFSYIWSRFSNTQCPVYTSGGVLTTRGASSAADFAANKAIAVPDWRGLGPMGVDTMGGAATARLAGVPVTLGSTTAPGSLFGENLHALSSVENGVHGHGVTDPGHNHSGNSGNDAPVHAHDYVEVTGVTTTGASGGVSQVINGIGQATAATGAPLSNHHHNIPTDVTDITINNSGSGTAHNTVQSSMGVYWYVKY